MSFWRSSRSGAPSPATPSPVVSPGSSPNGSPGSPPIVVTTPAGSPSPALAAAPRPPQAIDMAYADRTPTSLPLPATAATPLKSSMKRKPKKNARIDVGEKRTPGVRVHWSRFVKHLGTGTAPSASSAIGADESTAGDSLLWAGSRHGRRSSSRPATDRDKTPGQEEKAGEDDDGDVDEVVVDREWLHDIKSSVADPSEMPQGDTWSHHPGTLADVESLEPHSSGFATPFIILRYRVWPAIHEFFSTRFYDAKSENHYRKESWFMRKSLAMWAALFFILNWVLATAFAARPYELPDKIFYGGISVALTIPLFFLVVYDYPRDQPVLYQIYLSLSVWCWGIYQVVFMYMCGYYSHNHSFSCGSKDFVGVFYFTTGLPVIALFGLGLKRLPAAIGALIFFVCSCVLVLPYRTAWFRNVLDFLIFHAFLLYVHYMREHAERRLYSLRDQLKVQFRATQKAQVNERKASDSKRRLTSYVFHEVRVPLNTALLAVQNMAATGTFKHAQDIEFKALEGSLSMMSKVLNDVLDFNRMDSGRFESVSKPYPFSQVMRSMFIPLRLATDSRKLKFVTELDERIDLIARRAAYQAIGLSPAAVAERLREDPEEPGMVVGDEMRLRQIVTNLASNACKFTPSGGTITVLTRLIWPNVAENGRLAAETPSPSPSVSPSATATAVDGRPSLSASQSANGQPPLPSAEAPGALEHGLSARMLAAHDAVHDPIPERMIVRIEVSDTGCGIRAADITKLFSAFNQTEMGRQQGGKGTGLGLALVRQIVKRSGGRLGVRSKVGEGSTFWCEIPFLIGARAVENSPNARLPAAAVRSQEELGLLSHDSPPSSAPPSRPRLTPGISASSARSTRRSTDSPGGDPLALHTLMDQGGLVRLMSPHDRSANSIPTRTIGDPSTGTDALPSPGSPPAVPDTPVSVFAPAVPSDIPTRPPLPEESSSKTIVRQARPTSIALPTPSFQHMPTIPPSPRLEVLPPDPSTNEPALAPAAKAPKKATGGSTAAPSGPRMPVLVVDDDTLTRTLMKRMLTRLGCDVTTAENGALALTCILGPDVPTPSSENLPVASRSLVVAKPGEPAPWSDESKFGVVFLDNQMPVMSGVEAISRLRAAGRRDFVVGVTGNALLSDQEEYIEAGVDHVLTKPVLERSLRTMLDAARARQASRLAGARSQERPPSPRSMSPPTPPET